MSTDSEKDEILNNPYPDTILEKRLKSRLEANSVSDIRELPEFHRFSVSNDLGNEFEMNRF